MSDPLTSSRDPRGEQDPHARVLVPGAGGEIEGRANRLFGELRQRRVLLAQLVVVGQLIGQAGDVRQQVADRHVVPPVARERGQELLHAVVEPKLPLVEQGHDGRHVDRLGDGAEQEHRVARGRLAEVARERLVPLNHVQHGRFHLLRRRGPLEHLGRVIPPLPAQGREQGGSGRDGQGRPEKRASLHRTGSFRGTLHWRGRNTRRTAAVRQRDIRRLVAANRVIPSSLFYAIALAIQATQEGQRPSTAPHRLPTRRACDDRVEDGRFRFRQPFSVASDTRMPPEKMRQIGSGTTPRMAVIRLAAVTRDASRVRAGQPSVARLTGPARR